MRRRVGPAATTFRSAPAQKVPFAPHRTATRAPSSRSKARNAAASAFPVGRSIAFRRSGRSRMIVVTGPLTSVLTLGRSMGGRSPRVIAVGGTRNLTRGHALGYPEDVPALFVIPGGSFNLVYKTGAVEEGGVQAPVEGEA